MPGAGRAAVCVVRISGPQSRFILETIAGSAPSPRRLVLRSLRDPISGEGLDQALVATGAFWLLKGQPLLLRGFPTSAIEAGICLGGGLLLMIWSVAGILRAILAQAAARHSAEHAHDYGEKR